MRYAIFDIDGTISQRGDPLSPAMAEAITAARTRFQVVFASARPVRDMLPLLPDHLHDAVMVGCNGGMAWQRGKFLIDEKFEPDVIAQIVAWLDEAHAAYVIESHWHYGFSPVAHVFHDYVRSLNTRTPPIECRTVLKEGVNKILILDMHLRDTLLAHIAEQQWDLVEKHHRMDDCFDLMPRHTDKVNALDRLEITPEHAIIFGNDLNDQAMLARAGHAVVVGSFESHTPPHQRVGFEEVPKAILTLAQPKC